MKVLIIKHTKNSIKPYLFNTIPSQKIIETYTNESKYHPDLIFIYQFDDRLASFYRIGYALNGEWHPCTSDMFNFKHYIDAEPK